jgi:aminomethyltransferase
MAELRKTALHDLHEKLGARMVEFGGWRMPVQYSGIVDEHKAVREAAGVFDISHMGEFFFDGPGAQRFLNEVLTNDVTKLGDGQGQYTLMLNADGGVIDDLLVYHLQDDKFFAVVNAAKIDEDRAWVEQRLAGSGVAFTDASGEYGAVALQGPRSAEIARAMLGPGWQEPSRNHIAVTSWNCQEVLVARTGYTGEDGFEMFFKNEVAVSFFNTLLEVGRPLGLKPCGLGARDTLRLEACLPLNGNDLSPKRTPLEAGLGAFVSLTKDATFPGKEVLLKQKANGLNEKLVAFRLVGPGPPPRPHYALFGGEERVGEVTSGAPSPTLGTGIGLAYLAIDYAEIGSTLEMEVRASRVPVEVIKKPFYKRVVASQHQPPA